MYYKQVMNKIKAREIKGLILYRSQYGATAELGTSIKQGLESVDSKLRIHADARDISDGIYDFEEYDFFVFGSGIYKGLIDQYLGDVLIQKFQQILGKPHWAFIVCGTGSIEMQFRYKERFKAFLPDPVSIEAFRGRLKFEDLSEAHQKRIKAKYEDRPFKGYDHINHEAAKRFGRKIAKVVVQIAEGEI